MTPVVEHHGTWRRAADGTATDWVRHLVFTFNWMLPGHLKMVSLDERAEAVG